MRRPGWSYGVPTRSRPHWSSRASRRRNRRGHRRLFQSEKGPRRCSRACPARCRFRPSPAFRSTKKWCTAFRARASWLRRRGEHRHRLPAEWLVRRFGPDASRGQVAPEVLRLLDVTRRTLALAIELMGQKQWWSEVAREMEALRQGCGLLRGGELRGPWHRPRNARGAAGSQFRQQPVASAAAISSCGPGLVIAVEPMVNMGTKRVHGMPDHWTQVTADGQPSAHFEHTIAITKDGPVAADGRPG